MRLTLALRAVGAGLGHINRPLCLAARNAAAGLLAAMLVLVLVQILFRYGLNAPLAWTEEAARAAMIWLAFLVAPWAHRSGALVAVSLFFDALPAAPAKALRLLIDALAFWILAVLWIESLGFWHQGLTGRAASLDVPMAALYTVLPVGLGLWLSVAAERLVGTAAGDPASAADGAA